ncbi:MAG: hypothetical protein [Xiangshan rhabdo-like virus 4]|uniref:Uncharacterized protein n=1 Tax=Xiangshan rhabdo-like virus 4 TaxID=2886227 RepID=A0A8K1YQQ1_9RHAB|nr:MAG: hypothetical protein [Xiangshan rhabdo-like virus 4]
MSPNILAKFKRAIRSGDNAASSSALEPLKSLSYYIRGSFKITGPARIQDQHLSSLCLLVVVEAFIKRKYPLNVVNAVYTDLYQLAKLSQLRAKHSTSSLNYWETHVEVKKYINIPCVPYSVELFSKKSHHCIRFITEEEEIIHVEFNFFIATGDNSYLLQDCLNRQGYSLRKIQKLEIHPLIDRIITSEHIQMNYSFEELAKNVALVVSAKTGTKLQLDWSG